MVVYPRYLRSRPVDLIQQSVNSITHPIKRKVKAQGKLFLNRDRWTGRMVIAEMCEWAEKNQGSKPSKSDVTCWVNAANGTQVSNPEILIANLHDKITPTVFKALRGGGCHEALHTVYSLRRDLSVEEVYPILQRAWEGMEDWHLYMMFTLDWSNIIEDIRIERRGVEKFPGIEHELWALQDFILDMEKELDVKQVRSHGDDDSSLTLVMKIFREMGLDYPTEKNISALEEYREQSPEIYALVEEGPLRPFLDEAVAMPEEDGFGCYRLALEIVRELVKLGKARKDKVNSQSRGTKKGTSLQDPLGEILDQVAAGCRAKLLDNNSSLEETVYAYAPVTEPGEKVWNPYTIEDDVFEVVSSSNPQQDRVIAYDTYKKVKGVLAPYKTRLRTLFNAEDYPHTIHGLRKGNYLSGRYLVDSVLSIRAGRQPTRAFRDKDLALDLSLAVAVVVDESSSMISRYYAPDDSAVSRKDTATALMMLLADLFGSIGGQVQVTGFRSQIRPYEPSEDAEGYHRTSAVKHLIYMKFGERFSQTRWRFIHNQATGSTPMSDGIQLAWDSLVSRDEHYKLILVLTDGMPDHPAVVRWQLRQMRQQSIGLIGIGIGAGAEYVKDLFPDDFSAGGFHVWASQIDQLPKLLLEKLSLMIKRKVLQK